MKQSHKKIIITTVLEILFTVALVLVLVLLRQQAINYLTEVQDLSLDISGLENDLSTQNLTSYDKEYIQITIDKMNSLLDRGLLLIKFIMPLSIILLSLVFYFLIWRFISKVNPIRFIYSVIIPLILTLVVYFYLVLNYIGYLFGELEKPSLLLLILSVIVLIILYYLTLFLLSSKKSLKQVFRLSFSNLKKISILFGLNLILNFVYFTLVFIIFFLTYAGSSIILVSILLLLVIIIINIIRFNLFKRISGF